MVIVCHELTCDCVLIRLILWTFCICVLIIMTSESIIQFNPLTTHPHLVPKSGLCGAIPPLLQYAFVAWCSVKEKHRDIFTFPFTTTHWLLYLLEIPDYVLNLANFMCSISLRSISVVGRGIHIHINESLFLPLLMWYASFHARYKILQLVKNNSHISLVLEILKIIAHTNVIIAWHAKG